MSRWRYLLQTNTVWHALMSAFLNISEDDRAVERAVTRAEQDWAAGALLLEQAGATIDVERCVCDPPYGQIGWRHRHTCRYGMLRVETADGRTVYAGWLAIAELGRRHLTGRPRPEPVAAEGRQLDLAGGPS